jgi:hypothetical protein
MIKKASLFSVIFLIEVFLRIQEPLPVLSLWLRYYFSKTRTEKMEKPRKVALTYWYQRCEKHGEQRFGWTKLSESLTWYFNGLVYATIRETSRIFVVHALHVRRRRTREKKALRVDMTIPNRSTEYRDKRTITDHSPFTSRSGGRKKTEERVVSPNEQDTRHTSIATASLLSL